jgi:hypothetical protein
MVVLPEMRSRAPGLRLPSAPRMVRQSAYDHLAGEDDEFIRRTIEAKLEELKKDRVDHHKEAERFPKLITKRDEAGKLVADIEDIERIAVRQALKAAGGWAKFPWAEGERRELARGLAKLKDELSGEQRRQLLQALGVRVCLKRKEVRVELTLVECPCSATVAKGR